MTGPPHAIFYRPTLVQRENPRPVLRSAPFSTLSLTSMSNIQRIANTFADLALYLDSCRNSVKNREGSFVRVDFDIGSPNQGPDSQALMLSHGPN